MKVIGITGGIGSGKSMVSKLLEEHFGAFIINTDSIAHQLMKQGEVSYNKIVEYFGDKILGEDKEIDRGKLAKEVYGNADRLKILNSCSHPYVMSTVADLIKNNRDNYNIIAVESALPVEAKFNELCDESWYVHTPIELRKQRLKESRNYSDEKIESIFSSQLTSEEYKNLTQVELMNDGSVENLLDKIQLYVEK